MNYLIQLFENHLNYKLLCLIILSGIFITKYSKSLTRIENVHKVLIATILISVAFYFVEDCDKSCLPKYLFTYLFATSFYELLVKIIVDKITSILNSKK